jgi:hypothetical protein
LFFSWEPGLLRKNLLRKKLLRKKLLLMEIYVGNVRIVKSFVSFTGLFSRLSFRQHDFPQVYFQCTPSHQMVSCVYFHGDEDVFGDLFSGIVPFCVLFIVWPECFNASYFLVIFRRRNEGGEMLKGFYCFRVIYSQNLLADF